MSIVDWKAGMRITAQRLLDITPQWQEWTPAWTTTSGSNTPNLGDADVTAEYMEAGGLCIGRLIIIFGSTTDFGGGGTGDNWRFSLPVTAATSSLSIGFGGIQDGGGSAGIDSRMYIRVRNDTQDTMVLETDGGRVDATSVTNRGIIDAVTPFTWADGDRVTTQFMYPTAA